MDGEQLGHTLASVSESDRIPIVAALEPAIDREIWAVIAEHAYLTGNTSLKDAAAQYFVRCAALYTQKLSPSFHMVPWNAEQLLDESSYAAVYGAVARMTDNFLDVTPERIAYVLEQEPAALVIFRMIAAYSRNQVSFLLTDRYDVHLTGDDLRVIEREGREAPSRLLEKWKDACPSLGRLVYLAVRGELLTFREGIEAEKFRPLTDKVDTREGWESVARVAGEGLPYTAILYQRYIGSVFGQAINASTSLKADLLEGPVEKLLRENHIPFHRVGVREKVEGWIQAPDFFVPDKQDPGVLIEAKVAEDGGTARDKASRIERLARLAYARSATLISVVDGLGFFRINDVLAPILGNSKGLVYTYSDLREMLDVPALRAFVGTASE